MKYEVGMKFHWTGEKDATSDDCEVVFVGPDNRPVLWDGTETWMYDTETGYDIGESPVSQWELVE
jgi:hypothetical protein